MHGQGKSDSPIVPTKPLNKAGRPAAEVVEGKELAKGNTGRQNALRTQCRAGAPNALDRVRRAAKQTKDLKFTALFHHLTLDRLRAAFLALERQAAAGVDEVTWRQYDTDREAHLGDLHARLHRGAYRAKPSRRVFIPKTDGRQRPLGIAALEDKIVQRATVEILNAIYEPAFLGFSYGFRPGRSQHDALDALAVGLKRKKVNWVLDADIRGYFDAISHGWLVRFLEHQIADRRILRLLRKWLTAGVMQDGKWTSSEVGTPQGATVSPLLANVYLHYVLDLWVHQWRTRHVHGDVIVVRYADDFLVGFEHQSDAVCFMTELRARLAKFALELHPDKTRLIEFGRHAGPKRARRGLGNPETFDFLGFTHMCTKTRGGGFWVRRQTASKRMRAKLHEIKAEMQRRRHQPIPEQGRWIRAVIRGYAAYHAVPGNLAAIRSFRAQIAYLWQKSLSRRSQKGYVNWTRMTRLATTWLPAISKQHPWPDERFDARTRGRSPVR